MSYHGLSAVSLAVAGVLLVDPTTAAAEAASAPAGDSRLDWLQVSPAASPPALADASAAYDSENDLVVVFGGCFLGSCGQDDTWLFDGDNWSSPQLSLHPSRRYDAPMAYDSARNETVLFGGTFGAEPGVVYGDTWVFDGAQWTERAPAVSPPPLYGAALVYDPKHENVVLFGGALGGDDQLSAETWVWDGVTWEQQHPATSPTARYAMGGAYSRAPHAVVIFGGNGVGPGELDDTWSWNGDDWARVRSADAVPSPRLNPGMASYGRRVVLFGGRTDSVYNRDTWILGTDGWQEKARGPAPRPRRRMAPQLVYDSARHRAVMFSGTNYEADTWVFLRSD